MESETVTHPSRAELDAALADVRSSPSDVGTVEMIVRRPANGEREVVDAGQLTVGEGLDGDNYVTRGSSRTADGAADPEAQLNIMNARSVDACAAGDRSRWALAGDQFFVDFDLTRANLPAGTRLAVGAAEIEVSAKPHTGCAKFRERFGVDAARWVNHDDDLRLRGINATVVKPGAVRTGDQIKRL